MSKNDQEDIERNLRYLAKVVAIMDPLADYNKLWLISQLIFNLFMKKGIPREDFGNEMRRLGDAIADIYDNNQCNPNIMLVHKDDGEIKFGMN